ncbi:MAG: hypothetical protein AVDCRST_MAG19-1225, partial [uncultured Thermomicrobiales bacterium]
MTATEQEIVLNVPARTRDRVARATTAEDQAPAATETRAVRTRNAATAGRGRAAAETV